MIELHIYNRCFDLITNNEERKEIILWFDNIYFSLTTTNTVRTTSRMVFISIQTPIQIAVLLSNSLRWFYNKLHLSDGLCVKNWNIAVNKTKIHALMFIPLLVREPCLQFHRSVSLVSALCLHLLNLLRNIDNKICRLVYISSFANPSLNERGSCYIVEVFEIANELTINVLTCYVLHFLKQHPGYFVARKISRFDWHNIWVTLTLVIWNHRRFIFLYPWGTVRGHNTTFRNIDNNFF